MSEHPTSGPVPDTSESQSVSAEAGGALPGRRRDAGGFLVTLAVSVAVSAASLLIYDRYFAQKVVALDMKGYIAEQRDLYLSGRIDDGELRRRLDRLEEVALAIPANRVVLMGDAVVRNAEVIQP